MKRVLMPFRHASKVPAYQKAVCTAGLEAVPVLTSGTVSLDRFSGLLLMGGTDVNPARYGKPAQPETEQPDDERDCCRQDEQARGARAAGQRERQAEADWHDGQRDGVEVIERVEKLPAATRPRLTKYKPGRPPEATWLCELTQLSTLPPTFS